MVSSQEQKQRLERLLREATSAGDDCNYGAMLFIERPGDVCFLAPLFPEFRGIEIVSASPKRGDGRDYDLWHHKPEKLLQSNMTRTEVVTWLKDHKRTDETVKENIVQWAEEVFAYYGIRKR